MSRIVLISLLGFILSNPIYSNKIDSLRHLISFEKGTDTTQINILNQIADLFEERANDSCVYFAEKALKFSKQINFYKGCGRAYNTIGAYYNSKGQYQIALTNFINAFKIYKKINDRFAMSDLMNSIGNNYMGSDNVINALESYTQSYDIAEAVNNKFMMGISSIGLGNIHLLKKDASRALFFFTRAKDVFKIIPSAVYPLSISYTLIGNALVEENKFDLAFQNFDKAVENFKTLNNTYGIAATYQIIGEAYEKKHELTKALDYYHKSYSVFVERKAYDDLKNVCLNISKVYKQNKNFEKSLEFYSKYDGFKDSVLSVKKNIQLLEVQTKYETEKKDEQNIALKKQNDLSLETIKQQKIISYFIIVSLVISLFFGIFMYRVYYQKKKSHRLITLQKEEVEKKQIQIETQKQVIELKQKEIVDSINYAKRIQYALLANQDLLIKNLTSHFVFFKPKDIVSGDFYWATEHEDNFYLAVCDSTGHGVPGAFMSLLSIGFLSEAIKEKNIQDPNKVFNYVRKRLIESITSENHKDGFDGVLLRISKISNEVTYAASNNRPLLISNGVVKSLNCDKMPVGKGEKLEEFSLNTIEITKGDSLYLYTDGFADQFGGPKGKKFKYKPLNEMLFAINQKKCSDQKAQLETTFTNWRGTLEQVDDVLVLGINF